MAFLDSASAALFGGKAAGVGLRQDSKRISEGDGSAWIYLDQRPQTAFRFGVRLNVHCTSRPVCLLSPLRTFLLSEA